MSANEPTPTHQIFTERNLCPDIPTDMKTPAVVIPLGELQEKPSLIGRNSPVTTFLVYTFAVFFFFVLNGLASFQLRLFLQKLHFPLYSERACQNDTYLPEGLFRIPGFRPYGWFLTCVQFIVYMICSFGESRLRSTYTYMSQVPVRTYVAIAAFTVATTGLSNASIGYMNYPTQLMFKSCKVIPVMLGGILIQGKRYGFLEFGAVLLMSAGLVFFNLADTQFSPDFHARGTSMVSMALVADAFIGNLQEKAMKQYKVTNCDLILRCYTVGFLGIFCGLSVTGELFEAGSFCASRPMETIPLILLFCVTGYLGVNFVLLLIRTFGAVAAVTVTTCRKALTISLSFLLFTKPFTFQYVWSGLLVIAGLYMQVYARHRTSANVRLLSALRFFLTRLQILRLKQQAARIPPVTLM